MAARSYVSLMLCMLKCVKILFRLPTRPNIRATSHTRLRACHRSTSSTLIGGKARASQSSLHTTLEGPIKYNVNARWMLKSMWIPIWHQMDHVACIGHLDYFKKPPLGGSRPNTKLEIMHFERSQPLIYSILSCVRALVYTHSLK
jgi:hypothetical protein